MVGIEKFKLSDGVNIKYVIGVMSGKGGVGKSMVTSLIATHLKKLSFNVGILDCDLTGPSIPQIFGIDDMAEGNENNMFPIYSEDNIPIMSINLLLPKKTDPVIWRGPILMQILRDFWTKTYWGQLDVLLIDMPPGTGDVPLTIFQSFPIDGVIEVSSPSVMANVSVDKAHEMALRMNINVLGYILNMAYYVCPNCNEKHYVLGKLADKENIEKLGELPLNFDYNDKGDSGKIFEIESDEIFKIVNKIIDKLDIKR